MIIGTASKKSSSPAAEPIPLRDHFRPSACTNRVGPSRYRVHAANKLCAGTGVTDTRARAFRAICARLWKTGRLCESSVASLGRAIDKRLFPYRIRVHMHRRSRGSSCPRRHIIHLTRISTAGVLQTHRTPHLESIARRSRTQAASTRLQNARRARDHAKIAC